MVHGIVITTLDRGGMVIDFSKTSGYVDLVEEKPGALEVPMETAGVVVVKYNWSVGKLMIAPYCCIKSMPRITEKMTLVATTRVTSYVSVSIVRLMEIFPRDCKGKLFALETIKSTGFNGGLYGSCRYICSLIKLTDEPVSINTVTGNRLMHPATRH